MAGGGKKKLNHSNTKTKSRRRNSNNNSSSSRPLFVVGGVLSDWPDRSSPQGGGYFAGNDTYKKAERGSSVKFRISASSNSGPQKNYNNAFKYEYPTIGIQEGLHLKAFIGGPEEDQEFDGADPIVLVDSQDYPIVAFMDLTPSKDNLDVECKNEYTSGLTLDDSCNRGLGFYEVDGIGSSIKKTLEDGYDSSQSHKKESNASDGFYSGIDANLDEDLPDEMMSPQENSAFLSIGGMKLYTQDMTDQEEGGDDDDESMDESGGSSVPSSGCESSEDMSDGSDVDDGVAADCLEGIGGSVEVINDNKLLENVHSFSDACTSDSSMDETIDKLGGIALQDASRLYGMKKPKSKKKNLNSRALGGALSMSFDDLMFTKDSRKKSEKRKETIGFSRSFPSDGPKRKGSRNYPGEKKKHHKDLIAMKRRERMVRRGVDLQQISLELERMVLKGEEIHSFQPMHPRDCSQVRRVASIYGFWSGCQGSGKKRYVTVSRTARTGMPSSIDKLRLEKLIGVGEDDDFVVNKDSNLRTNKVSKGSGHSANRSRGNEVGAVKQGGGKNASFANQPVSFVSSGILQSDPAEIKVADEPKEPINSCENAAVMASSSFGAFEVHTTGFGSRMMVKMGFMGGGLGKDGKGLAEPIEVIQRPKSLGLGVEFSETSVADDFRKASDSQGKKTPGSGSRRPTPQGQSSKAGVDKGKKETQSIGAFEKHTKGFGSKMMVKMGFVEGTGLGRDSQGIVNSLVAVRRPKARGLGAEA